MQRQAEERVQSKKEVSGVSQWKLLSWGSCRGRGLSRSGAFYLVFLVGPKLEVEITIKEAINY